MRRITLALRHAYRPFLAAGFVSGFAFAPPSSSEAATAFTIEVLSQDHIDWPSLVFDAQDQPHLAFRYYSMYEGGLEYRHKTSGGWIIEQVPANMGYYGSLALDPAGTPHLTYFDGSGNDVVLRYATRSGNGWTAETIAIAGPAGITFGKTSLAFDAQGTPQVAYTVNDALLFARKSGVSWTVETLDTNGTPPVGRYPALKIDAQGLPYISYSDDSRLVLAHKSGTAWVFETVDSGGGLYSSLALDAAGNAHVSYYGTTQDVLKYACRTAQGWSIESPDSGALSSLALDAQGSPRISYQDHAGVLKYAVKSAGVWTTQTVDASELSGSEQSLALDSAGRPSVAYEFHTRYSRQVALRYARGDGATTDVEVTNRTRAWFSPVRPSPSLGATAQISFRLAQREIVTLQLYDVRGRLAAVRPPQTFEPGEHIVRWDTGTRPAGQYFFRLQTESGYTLQQRWTRLR